MKRAVPCLLIMVVIAVMILLTPFHDNFTRFLIPVAWPLWCTGLIDNHAVILIAPFIYTPILFSPWLMASVSKRRHWILIQVGLLMALVVTFYATPNVISLGLPKSTTIFRLRINGAFVYGLTTRPPGGKAWYLNGNVVYIYYSNDVVTSIYYEDDTENRMVRKRHATDKYELR